MCLENSWRLARVLKQDENCCLHCASLRLDHMAVQQLRLGGSALMDKKHSLKDHPHYCIYVERARFVKNRSYIPLPRPKPPNLSPPQRAGHIQSACPTQGAFQMPAPPQNIDLCKGSTRATTPQSDPAPVLAPLIPPATFSLGFTCHFNQALIAKTHGDFRRWPFQELMPQKGDSTSNNQPGQNQAFQQQKTQFQTQWKNWGKPLAKTEIIPESRLVQSGEGKGCRLHQHSQLDCTCQIWALSH